MSRVPRRARPALFAAAAALAVLAVAPGPGRTPRPRPDAPAALAAPDAVPAADWLADLRRRHERATESFHAYHKSPWEKLLVRPADRARRFDDEQESLLLAGVELAKADPASDVAFDACRWVLTVPRSLYRASGPAALDLLREHHAAKPGLGPTLHFVGRVAFSVGGTGHAEALALAKAVSADSPHRAERGAAEAALGVMELRRTWRDSSLTDEQRDAPRLAALRRLARAERDYGDVPSGDRRGGTLAESIRAFRDENFGLSVGSPPPPVAGVDYCGRVTLFHFWAAGHAESEAERPAVEALRERYPGRPLTVVCRAGPRSPLPLEWNAWYWPTAYLVDGAGVIRFKGTVGPELEKAVSELLPPGAAAP